MELLRQGQDAEAAHLVTSRARSPRPLVHRLWDASPVVRATAARALGIVAASDPPRGRELARRFLWALNDESGTNAAAVLPALEMMAAHAAEAVSPHTGELVALLSDADLRPGVLAVLEALSGPAPDALGRFAAPIAAALAEAEPGQHPQLTAVVRQEGRSSR